MTDIEIKGSEDVLGIVKERTEKCFQIARKLSDFIKRASAGSANQ